MTAHIQQHPSAIPRAPQPRVRPFILATYQSQSAFGAPSARRNQRASSTTAHPNPHRARSTAGCPTHRDFVPWRFSDADRISVWLDRTVGVRKPDQFADTAGRRRTTHLVPPVPTLAPLISFSCSGDCRSQAYAGRIRRSRNACSRHRGIWISRFPCS